MQPGFVDNGLLAWGQHQCHQCHKKWYPLRCSIASSGPHTDANGAVDWLVRIFCPSCGHVNGLLLTCAINWAEVRDWIRHLEKSSKQAAKPNKQEDTGKLIPSNRNPNAAPITAAEVSKARHDLSLFDDHRDFLQVIGVRLRDIYPPKKRPPK